MILVTGASGLSADEAEWMQYQDVWPASGSYGPCTR